MEACPELWCAFPYELAPDNRTRTAVLGCTRFRGDLMQRYPEAIECLRVSATGTMTSTAGSDTLMECRNHRPDTSNLEDPPPP
jgi:hypothetical protein